MSKSEIMTKVGRTFHMAAFKVKKHSPELLIAAGVVGIVGSTVMACKATLKVNEIKENTQDTIEKIHVATAEGTNEAGSVYTEEDAKKDLTIVYAQTAIEYAKLYAPAVILGTLSITAILAGHNITRKRNVALAAAYTAVDKSFKEYRGRVIERFGEQLDKELKYNIKAKEVEEIVVNEDGSETVNKQIVDTVDISTGSQYAVFFDNGCPGWTKDPEYNKMFLINQQRYANDLLKSRGHLFLNEVYDLIGVPRTKAGQQVGWIYDEKNPIGDNCVDFCMFDVHDEKKRDFINGYERTILLDFNVDGVIMDYI